MPFGFLKALFGGKGHLDTDQPDLRGPLNLGPGDGVRYYQQQFRVAGVIVLVEGVETRYQYFLANPDERRILTAEQGRDLVLTLQRVIDDEDIADYDGGDSIEWDGRPLALTNRGRASAWCLGDLPPEKVNEVAYREFEDDEEETLLVLEHWGQTLEARVGETAHEGELTIEREGEPEYEIKPPPKIDLRTVSEARRAREEEEEQAAADAERAELEVAREKLRLFAEQNEEKEEEADAPANFLDT